MGGPNITDVVIVISVFVLILSVWGIAVFVWVRRRSSLARKLEERLGVSKQEGAGARVLRLWHKGTESTTVVPGKTDQRLFSARLQRLWQSTGLKVAAPRLIFAVVCVALLVFAATSFLTESVLLGVGAGAVTILLFWWYVKRCMNQRVALFEKQFVDALEMIARSLRAGHPLVGAFHLIAEEIPAPVGDIFGEICQKQSLGVSLEEAIDEVAAVSGSSDMNLFSTAVAIQLRSGGNLADMMERLANVIRDRMGLRRRIRVLLAQTRLSKRVLVAMPPLLFVILNIVNPGYVEPLYSTPLGRLLLTLAVAGLVVGTWVMNRLAVLRF